MGAIAGIVFAFLFITSLTIIRLYIPQDPGDSGDWLTESRKSITLALSLLPFAGIAFLWFIGVLRDRIGELEDRFFATVFLGSGILFLSMAFISAAIAGGIILSHGMMAGNLIESGIYTFARTVAYKIVTVYAMKMAGVFMISTCTIATRIDIFPRWMALIGYALAVLLLLSSGLLYWSPLVFPLWVLMISLYILFANLRREVAV
jgi:hypothetical protein